MRKITKRYFIGGIFFEQSPLSYRNLTTIWGKTKGQFQKYLSNEQDLGQMFDELMQSDYFGEVIAVLVKPARTGWRGWWNGFVLPRKPENIQVDPHTLIVDAPEVAFILRDFFIVNVAWVASLLDTPLKSSYTLMKATPRQILSALWNIYSPSPAGTLLGQK